MQSGTFGIIGMGSFGCFIASHLAPFYTVYGYDRFRDVGHRDVIQTTLEEVCRCDYVMFAVPVQYLEDVATKAAPYLRAPTIVMDVCSVKCYPQQILEETLPSDVSIVLTHPLFGPQSGREGISGLPVVIWNLRGGGLEEVRRMFAEQIWLSVLKRDPETHDKEMARVQALTHFLSRGLAEMGLQDSKLATKSFLHMYAMQELLREDSWDLFLTIERWNPYAKEQRRLLLERLQEVEQRLSEE